MTEEVVLAVRSVTVEYPGVRALDSVSIAFRSHEIHAIVGENGAGKSTLMRVLAGAVEPSHGSLELCGRSVKFAQPSDAIRGGIAMVHQELNLVPTLTVAENISLGREPMRRGGVSVNRPLQVARAIELLAVVGAQIDPQRLASSLSIAQAQFVEIAKCLASEARVLIFDEPTAVLGANEAVRLHKVLEQLRTAGRTIIFISHHLDEVASLADCVSVLRDGALVAAFRRHGKGPLQDAAGDSVDAARLACAMVGRSVGSIYPPKGNAFVGENAIELRHFGAQGRSQGINLAVARGEIVGLAGLVGSGRTETAEAIVGLRAAVGTLLIRGRAMRPSSPRTAMRAGIGYVSEDRKGSGLQLSLSCIENTTLPSLDAVSKYCGLVVDRKAQRAVTAKWIAALGVRCARPALPVSTLSGGNQQKIALARWLETKPHVLIIDEPTRGVDVGAKGEIYDIIARLARGGLACIIISSELPELIGLAHRVVVIHAGRVAGEIDRAGLMQRDCESQIMRLASGIPIELEGAA
ncbi:MAG: sugar ABC transporter ATP-binding protein [Phycisphaerales bacterium]|nr:sugar ABC transporter ATP-binding protein [Phycisphaerales bacterium]